MATNAISTAVKLDGRGAISTVEVEQSIKGKSYLVITIDAPSGEGKEDLVNVPLFAPTFMHNITGVKEYISGANKTVVKAANFADFEQMCRFLSDNPITVRGCKIDTTDTDNLDAIVNVIKRDANGKLREVELDWAERRVPSSTDTGYARTMYIPEEDCNMIFNGNLTLFWPFQKKGTKTTFRFNISAQQQTNRMAELKDNSI